jgi:hypothetical protein
MPDSDATIRLLRRIVAAQVSDTTGAQSNYKCWPRKNYQSNCLRDHEL